MKKLKSTLLTSCFILIATITFAQIGIGTTSPTTSAALDVTSTNKGFLPPRVVNVNDVSNPVAGLQVYDQSVNCMRYYDGKQWSLCMGSKTYTCGAPFVDSRDSKIYNSMQIGTQCWMPENLAYLPSVVGSGTGSTTLAYYYVYDYQGTNVASAKATSNYDTYGVLYNWTAATTACPTGWHLPTDAEWKTLEMHLGMTQTQADNTLYRGTDEGSQLAGNESLWTNGNLDQNAEFGSSGFAAFPGGSRYTTPVVFNDQSDSAYFWSSDTESSGDAWIRTLVYINPRVFRYGYPKSDGLSVRCVQD